MGPLVVVLLLGLWASILLPGALRSRRASSPMDTVSDFERSMSMLSPIRPADRPPGREMLVLAHPASVTGGSNKARLIARRRTTLKGLVATVALTGVLTVVTRGQTLALFLVACVGFGCYAAMLRQIKTRQAQARLKTRRIASRSDVVVPEHHDLRPTG